MATWEREEIADQVSASVAVRAKLGKSLGGQAPFGYRWNERRLEPDPVEAPGPGIDLRAVRSYEGRKTVARGIRKRDD